MADPGAHRWLSLSARFLAVILITLASTVLIVALPTMVEDLDSSLESVQWVVSGHALVFASLLIIGGRLGDVYGHGGSASSASSSARSSPRSRRRCTS